MGSTIGRVISLYHTYTEYYTIIQGSELELVVSKYYAHSQNPKFEYSTCSFVSPGRIPLVPSTGLSHLAQTYTSKLTHFNFNSSPEFVSTIETKRPGQEVLSLGILDVQSLLDR